MTPEESEEYDELTFLLKQYVQESYARFIMGDLDIDNDSQWQDYLDELNNIGIGRYSLRLPRRVILLSTGNKSSYIFQFYHVVPVALPGPLF